MSLTEKALNTSNGPAVIADDVYDDGYLRVEPQNYYASIAGIPIKLPRTEFLIFARLARAPERIVTAEELWSHAWGDSKPLNTESLHVYIYRLRNKILPHNLRIDTMVNVGYRLLLDHSSPTSS